MSSVGATTPETITPGSLRAWWAASRPATLSVSAAPVFVGGALAWRDGVFDPLAFVAALLGAFALQVGANFANDLFDFVKGTDRDDRLGPARMAATGALSVRALRIAMWACFVFAALPGLYLIWNAGVTVLIIGVSSIAGAYLYTGGPKPLGYLGLGDLMVFGFFGPTAVLGTYFVQAHHIDTEWLFCLPVGLLSTAVLVVNNVRDIQSDRLSGKMTLPARFGVQFGRSEYVLLLTASYGVAGWASYVAGDLWLLLPLLSLPFALHCGANMLLSAPDQRLNPLLGKTAKLNLIFQIMVVIGLLQ